MEPRRDLYHGSALCHLALNTIARSRGQPTNRFTSRFIKHEIFLVSRCNIKIWRSFVLRTWPSNRIFSESSESPKWKANNQSKCAEQASWFRNNRPISLNFRKIEQSSQKSQKRNWQSEKHRRRKGEMHEHLWRKRWNDYSRRGAAQKATQWKCWIPVFRNAWRGQCHSADHLQIGSHILGVSFVHNLQYVVTANQKSFLRTHLWSNTLLSIFGLNSAGWNGCQVWRNRKTTCSQNWILMCSHLTNRQNALLLDFTQTIQKKLPPKICLKFNAGLERQFSD